MVLSQHFLTGEHHQDFLRRSLDNFRVYALHWVGDGDIGHDEKGDIINRGVG